MPFWKKIKVFTLFLSDLFTEIASLYLILNNYIYIVFNWFITSLLPVTLITLFMGVFELFTDIFPRLCFFYLYCFQITCLLISPLFTFFLFLRVCESMLLIFKEYFRLFVHICKSSLCCHISSLSSMYRSIYLELFFFYCIYRFLSHTATSSFTNLVSLFCSEYKEEGNNKNTNMKK